MTKAEMQLGKNGLTENFIQTLKNYFEKRENIRISVLKSARDSAHSTLTLPSRNRSAGHERDKIKKYAEAILESLGKNYTARVIGFTIVIKKWRKAKR